MKSVTSCARSRASMLIGVAFGAMTMAIAAGPAVAQSAQSAPPAEPLAHPNADKTIEPGNSKTAVPGATAPVAGLPSEPPAQSDGVEDIVVTGVRASVGSALQLQRNAPSLQQSIVAEDIGKLPDNNVVEALQHVEGVSIIRNNVEPGVVLIRGLPDIATTLNGRQLFSAAGRFVSLPDLPAELLARVDVKKAPSADDLEGGIAGLIDVSLHRPFDFKDLQLAASVKGTYGTLSQKFAPDISVLASNRWDTSIGEIGILVDASYQKRLVSTDRIFQNQSTLKRADPNAGTGPAVGVPAGFELDAQHNDLHPGEDVDRAGGARRVGSVAPGKQRRGLHRLLLHAAAQQGACRRQPGAVRHLPERRRHRGLPRHQRRADPAERLLRPDLASGPPHPGGYLPDRHRRQLGRQRASDGQGARELHRFED